MTARRLLRARDERGAVLVLFSLLLLVIVIMVALVLDLGVVRADRKTNKKAADVAAAAGIRALWNADGSARPWAGVCQAYNYLRGNSSELETFGSETWMDGTGSVNLKDANGVSVTGSPCAESPDHNPVLAYLTSLLACDPDDPATWAWFGGESADGRITVTIRSAYLLPDAFESGGNDTGDPDWGGCDQLGVVVEETTPRGFSAAFTDDELESTVRSVARLIADDEGLALAALILLEREDCLALNVEGNSGARVDVLGLPAAPGIIHSDSKGDGADCGGLNDSENVINVSTGSPSEPLIVAHESGNDIPGIIQIRALNDEEGGVAGNASDPTPTHVNAEGQAGPPPGAPSAGRLVGRERVDSVYLGALHDLRTDAEDHWGAAQAGYFEHESCTLPATVDTTFTGGATKVFVDCPGVVSVTDSSTFTAAIDEVVFNGAVSVSGDGTVLEFVNPRKLYVKGSSTANAFALAGSSRLRLNLDGTASCAARADYQDDDVPFDPERLETTKFVIGEGPFVTSGQAAVTMCQTTLFMADSSGPTTCALPANSSDNPAPYPNDCRGRISVAGQGDVDWSAPNRTSLPREADDIAELEDLAFWTETSAVPGNNCDPNQNLNCVQGNGLLRLQGIFVLPNSNPFRIAGRGVQDISADAQFWTRKLTVAGNGALQMSPDPNNSVAIPLLKGFALVR